MLLILCICLQSYTISNTITNTLTNTITNTLTNTLTNSITNTLSNTISMTVSLTTSISGSRLCRCGDGIVCGTEQCDSGLITRGSCCNVDCTFKKQGANCDRRKGPCFRKPRCTALHVCNKNTARRANAPCIQNGVAGTCNSANKCIRSGASKTSSKKAVSKSSSKKSASKSSKKAASKSSSKKGKTASKKVSKSSSKKVSKSSSKKVSKSSSKKVSKSSSKKVSKSSSKKVSKSPSKKVSKSPSKKVSKSPSKKISKSSSKKAKSKSPAAKSKTPTYPKTKFSIPKYKVGQSTDGTDELFVKFSVKNKGNNTAYLVVLTAPVPSGNTFSKFKTESRSSCTYDVTKIMVTCAVAEIPVGKLSVFSWRLNGGMQSILTYTAKVIAVNAASYNVTASVI